MLYGMTVWYGDIRRDFERALKRAQSLGFDYIEFSLDYPVLEGLSKAKINKLRRLKKEYNLDLAFHAPWAGVELAHPRKEISKIALKVMEKAIKFASQFSPIYFNFHLLANVATFRFKEIRNSVLKQGLTSVNRIVDLAEGFGIPITIENNTKLFFGTPNQFKFILKKIPKMRFCMDIGHAAMSNWHAKQMKMKEFAEFARERTDIQDWFNQLNEKIYVIHLHDCLIGKGRPLDHLVLGRGSLNLKKICKEINRTQCKYILLETHYAKGREKYPSDKDFINNLNFCCKHINI